MKRILFVFIILTFMAPQWGSVFAQSDTVVAATGDLSVGEVPSSVRPMHTLTDLSKLTADSIKKWDFHLSMGSSFIGGTYSSASLFGITPSLTYHPGDRLTVKASASALNSYSFMQSGYRLRGQELRNMAPVRDPGAVAYSASIAATYKIGDRLWIGAAVRHFGGSLATGAILDPWYSLAMMRGWDNGPVDLNATTFTAAMRYRIGKESYLDIHMTYIDDRTGALTPYYLGHAYGAMHSFSTQGWFNYYDPIFDSKW